MINGWAAVPYVPGLNNSAYRSVPISLSTCLSRIASTAAWMSATGMLGSKIFTLGPKSGCPPWAGGEAAAVPLHDSAVTRELRKRAPTRMRRTQVLAGVDEVETLRRFIGAPLWGDEVRRPIG